MDVEKTQETTQISNKKQSINQSDTNTIYIEYRKLITSMDKASSIKDAKALSQLYKQINKFRTGFTKKDFSYISENFLCNKISFSNLTKLDGITTESLKFSFLINPKYLMKVIAEVPEFYYFNVLLLILTLIDDKLHQEAFDKLSFLIGKFKERKYSNQTIAFLKAKTFYYYSLEAERLGIYSTIIK